VVYCKIPGACSRDQGALLQEPCCSIAGTMGRCTVARIIGLYNRNQGVSVSKRQSPCGDTDAGGFVAEIRALLVGTTGSFAGTICLYCGNYGTVL
jgi:hypothetical protein